MNPQIFNCNPRIKSGCHDLTREDKVLQYNSDSFTSESMDEPEFMKNVPKLQEAEVEKLLSWIENEKFGDFLPGTRIIACKTFLDEPKWIRALEPNSRFQLYHLVTFLKNEKQTNLSLIIDINRSYDYYNFQELKQVYPQLKNVKHIKFCLENGVIPNESYVNEIYDLLKTSHEAGEVVAIHCFHGINRTGYLVCYFLCKYFGMVAEEAINIFEKSRKHKIDYNELTDDLKKKFPLQK
jgi:atypical dual specificity phosphatase